MLVLQNKVGHRTSNYPLTINVPRSIPFNRFFAKSETRQAHIFNHLHKLNHIVALRRGY